MVLTLIGTLCRPECVKAEVIAADSFNYLAGGGGSLHGKNGGTGWAGGWVTNNLGNTAMIADATAAELTFAPAGGELIDGGVEAVEVFGSVNQPVASRQLASAQTGTFYVAYLFRLTAGSWTDTDTFSIHLANNGGNTSTLNFGMRGDNDANVNQFMVRTGTAAPLAGDSFGGSVALNTTHLLVARVSKPGGSGTFDQIDVWVNSGLSEMDSPDATFNLAAGAGLASISHVIIRAAALEAADRVRVDELKLATEWTDIIVPLPVVPKVNSFSLMHPGNAGSVPGYDPLTNGAVFNLLVTGTNLNIRANTAPSTDFGSVVWNLNGATTGNQIEDDQPWALFGDASGSYNSGQFNLGVHSLTATPYDGNGGAGGGGTAGNPLTISFTVTNFIVVTNALPIVALTNPPGGSSFTAPAELSLEATASDLDGSVTNVAFYAGTTKIGEDATPPFSFLWTNVSAGAYSLTARAIDDQGDTTVSAANVISVLSTNTHGVVSGDLKKWHRVSVTWDGPITSETATPNPFRDHRLNVTFTHPGSSKSYRVPGFFAADGDAANTSADSGNKWRVHFAPDETGQWSYVASFRTGTDVATNSSPTAGTATDFDGASGTFLIGPTDKTGRDFRGKGRLQYVGKHHLRFAETGEYFLKMGADSPENLLAYVDFDDTPNVGNLRKTWSFHASDYQETAAAGFTWKSGKGTNILGTIKYLADKGMNAFSFLTFSLDGDDDNVFPHRLANSIADYQSIADDQRWASGVVFRDRFDVSKLEQWDRIFAYGEKLGMYLHFKLMETENELRMDGGNLGVERMLYYRELIARFGYHLALNWNLGEEINNASTAQKQAWSQYFYDHDPYRHLQVIHNGAQHFDLLGNASRLTGFSRQTHPDNIFAETLNYLHRSATNGRPWVVAYDEQNPAGDGIITDGEDFNHDSVRGKVIWSHLLAGGAGVESYFGYGHPHNDLNCQDFRRCDNWWNQCRYALQFFYGNGIPFWNMTNRDNLLTGLSGTHCFALTGQVYVTHLPTNSAVNLNLSSASGEFTVRWFDPRHGGDLQTGNVTQVSGGSSVSLGQPPATGSNDWVALVKLISPDTNAPSVIINSPPNGASLPGNLPVQVSATVTDNVAVASAELWVDGSFQPPALTNVPIDFSVMGLILGEHILSVVGEDISANRGTNSVTITVVAPEARALSLVSSSGVWQLAWTAPGFVLDHALAVSGPWTNVLPPAFSPFPLRFTNTQEYFRLRWENP